jgi:hypothetical protein
MKTENKITDGNPNNMSVVERVKAPTPKFFKTLRTIGLALATMGGILLAAPVALPAVITSAAGYIALAGSVMTAVSQTAVDVKYESTMIENETP